MVVASMNRRRDITIVRGERPEPHAWMEPEDVSWWCNYLLLNSMYIGINM